MGLTHVVHDEYECIVHEDGASMADKIRNVCAAYVDAFPPLPIPVKLEF